MSDLPVYHHVDTLLKLLDYRGGTNKTEDGTTTINANAFVDILIKNRTPNVSVPVQGLVAVKSLSEASTQPEAVNAIYERIRMKNRRELDPCVSLLSLIAANDKRNSQVRHFLKRNAEKMRGSSASDRSAILRDKPETNEKTAPGPCLNFDCALSWDFESLSHSPLPAIGELPVNVQEIKLIDDLLYCLGGINGQYIRSEGLDSDGMRNLVVDETADASLRELITRILPVCADYSIIVRFIEDRSRYDHGLVNQALAAAMRHLLKDYYVLIAQLESQFSKRALTMQKMWFYLQPTMKNCAILSYVAVSVTTGGCHGGSVLSVLHKIAMTQTGDVAMRDLMIYLLRASAEPYFGMLERWIYKGEIRDPYQEFFVVDNETERELLSDEYWEKKYSIARDKIPVFLEKVADNVLRTGKYLNVIQQCGRDVNVEVERMVYSVEERSYVEQTEKAYAYASKSLLALLLEDEDLIGRLRSLKHYFLMDQGDFIVQFMDMAEEELSKDVDDIIPTRLEFLLELALRTSVANSDKYKDDVGINILEYDLPSQMFKIMREKTEEEPTGRFITGIEAFVFQYKVKWPLSLVINRQATACYQMLFRHLFYCKYVERLLGNVWSMNKVAKSYSLDSSRGYACAFALRQQMLSFIQALQYYMNFEILEPNWHDVIAKMSEAEDVDRLMSLHGKFLDGCLKDCMLTLPHLLRTLVKLLKLCVAFANFMKKTHHGAVEAELSLLDVGCGLMSSPPNSLTEEFSEASSLDSAPLLSFRQRIEDFQSELNRLLLELLRLITTHDKEHYSDKLVNMWYRLDFNGFYVNQLKTN